MNYPKYFGNYLGIVVQNNDPLKRGRVKVFVPHISPTVYNKWVETGRDKCFKFLGKNVYSDLTDILDELKKVLPWAEIAAPLAGESGSGRYNAHFNIGTISDSSDVNQTFSSADNCEIDYSKTNEYSQNLDNIGEKPGFIYDVSYYKLKDAFADPAENNTNNVNIFTYNYTPECYSNCAKGAFPILNVGAHVWVFFNNGDPLKPVIFGTSYGSDDWGSIFGIANTEGTQLSATPDEGLDYPGAYENAALSGNRVEYDINADTYRNKYVLNQKGGTIAIVNTDNREMLKLTHYSGSFKEFNNHTTIELATNNDQKLVLGDSFLTIRGTRNEFTQFDYDCVVKGDHYRKVGNLNKELYKQWRETARELADTKQLFDIQRSSSYSGTGGTRFTAPSQSRSGTPDKCPVCNKDTNKYFAVNTSYKKSYVNKTNKTVANSKGDFVFGKTILPKVGRTMSVPNLGNLGTPINVSPVDGLGGSVDGSTGMNRPGMIFGKTCPACGGTGLSPSSQGGRWTKEPKKQNFERLLQQKICELADIEKKMGIGGSEIVDITKHKVENIGSAMNDYGAVRIDPKGKMYVSDVEVGKYGTFYNRTPTPLVEMVQVTDQPAGNYTLNVSNKYNCMVGAGGMNMKSYGAVNISGAMTNVAGSQVNISSENEVTIDGGKRINITGDVVSLKQRDKKQIVVEGSLGITNNTVVAGGLHVEGEGTFNHITMPKQISSTEQAQVFGAAATDETNGFGKIIGYGVPLANAPTAATDPNGGLYFNPDVPGAPAFVGITDMTLTIGRIKGSPENGEASNIGYIPIGCIATLNPTYGWIANPENRPTPNTAPIPILGGICSSAPGAASAALDAPVVFGTGTPNIRGAYSKSGGSTDAGVSSTIPINNASAKNHSLVLYGTGRQSDSFVLEPHSHLFPAPAMTLTDTNMAVREKASGKLAPINAEPPANAPILSNNSLTNNVN
jgi:hypothetical protein